MVSGSGQGAGEADVTLAFLTGLRPFTVPLLSLALVDTSSVLLSLPHGLQGVTSVGDFDMGTMVKLAVSCGLWLSWRGCRSVRWCRGHFRC